MQYKCNLCCFAFLYHINPTGRTFTKKPFTLPSLSFLAFETLLYYKPFYWSGKLGSQGSSHFPQFPMESQLSRLTGDLFSQVCENWDLFWVYFGYILGGLNKWMEDTIIAVIDISAQVTLFGTPAVLVSQVGRDVEFLLFVLHRTRCSSVGVTSEEGSAHGWQPDVADCCHHCYQQGDQGTVSSIQF